MICHPSFNSLRKWNKSISVLEHWLWLNQFLLPFPGFHTRAREGYTIQQRINPLAALPHVGMFCSLPLFFCILIISDQLLFVNSWGFARTGDRSADCPGLPLAKAKFIPRVQTKMFICPNLIWPVPKRDEWSLTDLPVPAR